MRNGFMTYDRQTIDSAGVFLIGELERLDQTMHEPLVSVMWGRDIDLREDVSIADEVSSFTLSNFASSGGIQTTGKSWIGKDTDQITGMSLDIGKTAHNLYLWGNELAYTIPELESSQRLGRPVDAQKYAALQLKHNMDIDEMVYTGDTLLGFPGLTNNDGVNGIVTNVAPVADTGTGSSTLWSSKTPDEILADVNELLTSVWSDSAWALCPSRLLLPPTQFGYISSQKVSDAGNISIKKFLEENSIAMEVNGRALEIYPSKWLVGRGVPADDVATDRMMAYTKDKMRVRFPLVPLQRTPLEYRSIKHITTYFGRLGVLEVVYPETIGYRDGI